MQFVLLVSIVASECWQEYVYGITGFVLGCTVLRKKKKYLKKKKTIAAFFKMWLKERPWVSGCVSKNVAPYSCVCRHRISSGPIAAFDKKHGYRSCLGYV